MVGGVIGAIAAIGKFYSQYFLKLSICRDFSKSCKNILLYKLKFCYGSYDIYGRQPFLPTFIGRIDVIAGFLIFLTGMADKKSPSVSNKIEGDK